MEALEIISRRYKSWKKNNRGFLLIKLTVPKSNVGFSMLYTIKSNTKITADNIVEIGCFHNNLSLTQDRTSYRLKEKTINTLKDLAKEVKKNTLDQIEIYIPVFISASDENMTFKKVPSISIQDLKDKLYPKNFWLAQAIYNDTGFKKIGMTEKDMHAIVNQNGREEKHEKYLCVKALIAKNQLYEMSESDATLAPNTFIDLDDIVDCSKRFFTKKKQMGTSIFNKNKMETLPNKENTLPAGCTICASVSNGTYIVRK